MQDGTYICHTKERYEEGGNHDEEGELLSVLVEEFELVDQPCDHRFHPTHLRKEDCAININTGETLLWKGAG